MPGGIPQRLQLDDRDRALVTRYAALLAERAKPAADAVLGYPRGPRRDRPAQDAEGTRSEHSGSCNDALAVGAIARVGIGFP